MTALYPITLADIRAHGPCEEGWVKLLRALGSPPKSRWSDIHVTLGDIAHFNGVADAIWCARVLPDDAKRYVLRALLPSVRRAATHTTDKRVHDCINAVARWVNGDDNVNLTMAEEAVYAAREAAGLSDVSRAAAWTAWTVWAMASVSVSEAEAWAVWAMASVSATDADVDVDTAIDDERARQRADIIAVFGRLHKTEAAA